MIPMTVLTFDCLFLWLWLHVTKIPDLISQFSLTSFTSWNHMSLAWSEDKSSVSVIPKPLHLFPVTIIFSPKSVSALSTAAVCDRQWRVLRTLHGDHNNKTSMDFLLQIHFQTFQLCFPFPISLYCDKSYFLNCSQIWDLELRVCTFRFF